MNQLVSRRRGPNVDRTEQRRTLVAALRAVKPGETITYAELGRLIGVRDIRQIWHVLNLSRNDVLNRFGLQFEAAVNVGLRRVASDWAPRDEP